MAAIVASKVRKQRELSPNKQEELAALAEEHLRKKLAQIPGQNGRRRKDFPNGDYDSGGANVILYIGLGMVAMGLVITFVGLGDKGFRTLELKLIGPSLVGCGMFFALLRVLFCTLPSCFKSCMKCCGKAEETEKLLKDGGDSKNKAQASKLEAGDGKVSARPPGPGPGRAVQVAASGGSSDPGAARRGSLMASMPGGSDWRPPFDHREIDPRSHIQSAPHYVSDSEEDIGPIQQYHGKLSNVSDRPLRNHRNGIDIEPIPKPLDSISNSSSSTFSVNDLEGGLGEGPPGITKFDGSTVNLRTGEIILNATKLEVNEQTK